MVTGYSEETRLVCASRIMVNTGSLTPVRQSLDSLLRVINRTACIAKINFLFDSIMGLSDS